MMWETITFWPGATVRLDYALLVLAAIVAVAVLGVLWARR